MHCGDRDPEAGGKQERNHKDNACGKQRDRRELDEGGDRVAGRAADHLQVQQRRLHDLSESEGRECQIDAAGAQNRNGHDECDQAGCYPAQHDRQHRRYAIGVAQEGRRISPDCPEAGEAQVELARGDRQERPVGKHNIDREQHQDAFQIAAHMPLRPAGRPANKPVGRMNRISSNNPKTLMSTKLAPT